LCQPPLPLGRRGRYGILPIGANSAGNMDLVIDLFLRCLMDGSFGIGPGMLFPYFSRLVKPVHTFSLLPAGGFATNDIAFFTPLPYIQYSHPPPQLSSSRPGLDVIQSSSGLHDLCRNRRGSLSRIFSSIFTACSQSAG